MVLPPPEEHERQYGCLPRVERGDGRRGGSGVSAAIGSDNFYAKTFVVSRAYNMEEIPCLDEDIEHIQSRIGEIYMGMMMIKGRRQLKKG